jgi:hypothetical protein
VLLEGWHPDPSGRHELRWFDGHEWTWTVHSAGITSIDAGNGTRPDPAQVSGGGTLFSETHITVSQTPELFEVTERFTFATRHGLALAHATEPDRHVLDKLRRVNQGRTFDSTYSLTSSRGLPILQMHRPGANFASEMSVADGPGRPLGRIVQENMIGTPRLSIQTADGLAARVTGDTPLFNQRYAITSPDDTPIGMVTRHAKGVLRWDTYVLTTDELQRQPLRSLLIALVLFVDSAFHNGA